MSRRPLRFDEHVARLWTTMPPSKIAQTVGCSVATVYIAARRTGVLTAQRAKGHRWTSEEDEALRRRFPNARSGELEAQFGLSFEQIRSRAKRLDIPSRQALALAGVQHDFFARGTPDAAYVAGLLMAGSLLAAPRSAPHSRSRTARWLTCSQRS